MSKFLKPHYTLVEHNRLRHAVMLVVVKTAAQVDNINAVGGVVSNNYNYVQAQEDSVNKTSIVPNMFEHGAFSDKRHNGRRIFVPRKALVEAVG